MLPRRGSRHLLLLLRPGHAVPARAVSFNGEAAGWHETGSGIRSQAHSQWLMSTPSIHTPPEQDVIPPIPQTA